MNATFLTRHCFILVIGMYMCTCIYAQQETFLLGFFTMGCFDTFPATREDSRRLN